MKTPTYKKSLLLLTIVFLALNIKAQEVTREYHEEYTGVSASTLEIDNRYGNVVVDSWENDQIIINVKVTVELPDRARAEKLIEYITVDFKRDGDVISAKTVIDDRFNFSGWSGNRRFSIDYSIRMPVEASLAVTNRYGNTSVDEIGGIAEFDIKYGNLDIVRLTRGNEKPINRVSVAYGKGTIQEAGWLDIVLRYTSGMDIDKGQAFLVDSKYSKLNIGEVSSIVGESRYDNMAIETINNLVLDNGYTEVKIGTLTKKLDYKGSYGSFTVNRIPSGFEAVDVDTRYMGVNLGIAENASYNLEASVSYGGLRYNEDNFLNRRRIIENNKREIEGTVGKNENPDSYVNITSSYGSVRLY